MDDLIYINYICIVTPLTLMLFLLERKARQTIVFMIVGISVCLLASEINGLFLQAAPGDMYYITTTITPVTEELLKAFPVLFFAFVFSDEPKKLLSAAMAVGIGFALLENTYVLAMNASAVSVPWAVVRGFGSGLMHGVCTAAVGYGASYVHKRKKLFVTGTFALLTAAVIYHATYNALVQWEVPYFGFLLPAFTYIPVVFVMVKRRGARREPTK